MQTYEARRRQEPAPSAGAPADALTAAARPPVYTSRSPARSIDLPAAMREKMESAFGMDLSALRLYESRSVEDAGAEALAQGNRIVFAPGRLDLSGTSGQALLGHELSHLASQARGESRGSGLLDDPALEARADREGAMAAAGQTVYAAESAPLAPVSAPSAPVQAKKSKGKKALNGISYVLSSYNILSSADNIANSKYKDASGKLHDPLSGISSKANRTKNGVKSGVTTLAGLYGAGMGGYSAYKKGSVGNTVGAAASTLDALAGLGAASVGSLCMYNNFRKPGRGETEKSAMNQFTKKYSMIGGMASSGLSALSGLLTGGSALSTENAMKRRTANANAPHALAFRQAQRNASVEKQNGFMKMVASALKGGGTAVSSFAPGLGGLIGGSAMSMLGDAMNMVNLAVTEKRKKNNRKQTLREAGLDPDSTKNLTAAGKQAALRGFIQANQNMFDANLLARYNNDTLTKRDLYDSMTAKRADDLAARGDAGQVAGDLGIHTDDAAKRKNGIMSKLLG